LKQVPRLAVPYANLYREVQVQEAVNNLLTQQYEIARIQEAKDVPVVNVIDAPGIPEKKSFPPRGVLTLALTFLTLIVASFVLVLSHHWENIDAEDPRRRFGREVIETLASIRHFKLRGRMAS